MSEIKQGTMNIGGFVYITKETELPHLQLRFYAKNPRVYSELIHDENSVPTQQEIEDYMISTDRVRELKEKIKANNGLLNAVIVRDGDFSVLEGNTRLAAYRLLNKLEPENETWKKMKCVILPANITEDAISILLGAFHIKGTKDWDPYEQAGYLYRWKQTSKLPVKNMADQLGVSKGTVESMINVYTFMKEHDDLNKNHWSYYEEYLKNSSLKSVRAANPNVDIIFVTEVLSGQIPSAQYVRKFGDVAKAKGKEAKRIMNEILSGETSIQDGYEILAESGKFDDVVKKTDKFKNAIMADSYEKQALETTGSSRADLIYNLKKINKETKRLLEILGG